MPKTYRPSPSRPVVAPPPLVPSWVVPVSVVALVLVLAGLLLGFQVVRIYDATQQLAIGYSLITVLLVIVGVLSLFVGIMLHAIREIIADALRDGRSRPG